MNFYKALFIAAVTGLLACSCHKEDSSVAAVEEGGVISFGLSGELVSSTVHTKAPVVLADFNSFKVTATNGTLGTESRVGGAGNFENIVFSTADSPVTGSSVFTGNTVHKYWILPNPTYHFYASNLNMNAISATGNSTVTVTVADNTTDLVTAYLPTPTYGAKNTLAFEHAYACVSTVKVNAGGYDISNVSVQLINKQTHGTYDLVEGSNTTKRENGTAWTTRLPAASSWSSGSNPGAAGTVIYSNAGTISSGSYNTGADNSLLILPGDYYLCVSWTATKDDYVRTYSYVGSSSALSFVGGKNNSVELTLSGNAVEISFGISLTAWSSNNIDVGQISSE